MTNEPKRSLKIPRTSLQLRYKEICKMSYAQRIADASAMLADPSELVSMFAESVLTFEKYENPEHFYSNKNRSPGEPGTDNLLGKSTHLAQHLNKQKTLIVEDHFDLNAEYVDYEIAPTRTTGAASFDDDPESSWRGGIFIDLILANQGDRTPIIAELKIRQDKDPYTALIQMLVGIVLLASRPQYARLREFLPLGNFPETQSPRFDGYLFFHEFNDHQVDLVEIDLLAKQLAELLMKRSEITRHIRQIVSIDVNFDSDAQISGSLRWRHISL